MNFKSVCLIGNPNCGKTTLFNALTGTYQKVGNWAGVTTEAKTGTYKKDKSVSVTDLPGLYSLSALSKDEKAVLEYLKNSPPDVLVNVLDGTNLERNLFLTCELVKLKIPVIVAVNFADDLIKNGVTLNENELSQMFGGVPVVLVSALKKTNIDALMQKAKNAVIPVLNERFESSADVYAFIESKISALITKKQTRAELFTLKADGVLTHGVFGVMVFVAVITAVYFFSIKTGLFLGGFIEKFFVTFGAQTRSTLTAVGAPAWLVSLITDAVFNGLGTVLAFLPQILALFFLMTLLEESGYMARVAFLLDGLFKKSGLGGKSLIPLAVSCGCSVTGIMAARTIENENERVATIILAPFMPCGAKTAVFGWFASVFFNGNPLIAVSLYFLSVVSVMLGGKILRAFKPFKTGSEGFMLEMPTLRAPSIKNVFAVLREKTLDFVAKAGTVIFAVSVALWALCNFGFNGYTHGEIEKSFVYLIGNGLKYLFYPLGFGRWQAAVAVVTGVLAKEAVIETLNIVCTESAAFGSLFNSGFSVYAFMAFVLLMPPCVAALTVARRELHGRKTFAFMLGFQTLYAYVTALIINLTGIFFSSSPRLIITVVFVIIIAVSFVACIKSAFGGCENCGKTGSCQKCRKKERNTI